MFIRKRNNLQGLIKQLPSKIALIENCKIKIKIIINSYLSEIHCINYLSFQEMFEHLNARMQDIKKTKI